MFESVIVSEIRGRQFSEKLKHDDLTKWACELSGEHLKGVFWLVGELHGRGHCLLELFNGHPEVFTLSSADAAKSRVGLEYLIRNDAWDVTEMKHRLTEADFSPPRRDDLRPPVFSLAYRRELQVEKYARWASELSEESLEGQLWLLGAVAKNIVPRLAPAIAYVALSPWPDFNELRPRIALDGIFRVVALGERFDKEQVRDFILSGLSQWRRDCTASVPFTVRTAVANAVPEAIRSRLNGVDRRPDGYLFSGDDQGRSFSVTVGENGQDAAIQRRVSLEDIPEVVQARYRTQMQRLGSYASEVVFAIGRRWDSADSYRFFLARPSDTRTIVISADGSHVEVEQR